MFLSFAAVLLGYFLVWLPQDAVGLSFIGLEIGEWVKFLPQVQQGTVAADRDLFYLPPVTLATMMLLFSADWLNRRWQSWAFRGLALSIALLAIPSPDAIRLDPPSEWGWRLALVAMAILLALATPLVARLSARARRLLLGVAALSGALLPAWAFLALRPAMAAVLPAPVIPGPGFWLNTAGHLAAAYAALGLVRRPGPTVAESPAPGP